MSTTLPSVTRACTRTGVRVLAAGALAIGLLTSAPPLGAHAATAGKAQHHGTQHHGTKHHGGKGHGPKRPPAARKVARAMSVAVAQKGDPYSYGASGPNSFDCSGLTSYSFRRAGFPAIPRTASAQSHFAHRIMRTNMHRGDLIFFYDGGGVYHVGLFAGVDHGRRMVLHAPYSGTRVRTEPLWTDRWFPATLRFR